MEGKERYEIHIYDDICVALYDNGVLDKSINDTYKLEELLNQQDKRIKELEEELDDAKRDYIPKLEFGLQRANKMGRDAEEENRQLKQQLHDLPKKIVEEIRKQLKDMDFLANDTELGERFICYSKYKVLDILLKIERNQVKGESNVKD